MDRYLCNFLVRHTSADVHTMVSDLQTSLVQNLSKYGEVVKPMTDNLKLKKMLANDWHDAECRQVYNQLNDLLKA